MLCQNIIVWVQWVEVFLKEGYVFIIIGKSGIQKKCKYVWLVYFKDNYIVEMVFVDW